MKTVHIKMGHTALKFKKNNAYKSLTKSQQPTDSR